jgi:hypothetical protein
MITTFILLTGLMFGCAKKVTAPRIPALQGGAGDVAVPEAEVMYLIEEPEGVKPHKTIK